MRRASGHAGPFPRVSIWHGSADPVVNPANAGASVLQWTDVHGIGEGVLLSTTAPRDVSRKDAVHDGLTIDIAENTINVAVGNHQIVTFSDEKNCEWSVFADETETTVAVDGDHVRRVLAAGIGRRERRHELEDAVGRGQACEAGKAG